MSGERWELVTDWASLRAGDLVAVKPCMWCGTSEHRDMITVLTPANPTGFARGPRGEIGRSEAKWLAARSVCAAVVAQWGVAWARYLLSESSVTDRRVYRVIIPPVSESTEDVTETKTLERVR